MGVYVIAARLRLKKKAVTAFVRHPIGTASIDGGFAAMFAGWGSQEAIRPSAKPSFKQVKHAFAHMVDAVYSGQDPGGLIAAQQSTAQSLFFYRELHRWCPDEIALCFGTLALAAHHHHLASPTHAVLFDGEELHSDKILSVLEIGRGSARFVHTRRVSAILKNLQPVRALYLEARQRGFSTSLQDRAYVHQQICQVARYPKPAPAAEDDAQRQAALGQLFAWEDMPTVAPSEALELARVLLGSMWRKRYPEIPAPEIEGLQASITGTSLRITGPGWVETGDLGGALSLCERVWFRLGWPMLLDSDGQPNSTLVIDQFDFIDGPAATRLHAQAQRWPVGQRCSLVAELCRAGLLPTEADPQVWTHAAHPATTPLASFDPAVRAAILSDDSETFVKTLFGGRGSASRMLLLSRLSDMMSDRRPLQRAAILREGAEIVRGAHWENPATILARGRALLEQVGPDDRPPTRQNAGILRIQLADWCMKAGLYAESLALLDPATAGGFDHTMQFYRRWICQSCLGDRAAAEADWHIFSGLIDRLIAHAGDVPWWSGSVSLANMRVIQRVEGLLAAIAALGALRDGWPTARFQREKCKQPKPPSPARAAHFAQARQDCIDELTALLGRATEQQSGLARRYAAKLAALQG